MVNGALRSASRHLRGPMPRRRERIQVATRRDPPSSNKLVSLPPSTLIILWFPPWFSVPSNPRENPLFRDFRLFHRFFGGTT